MIFTDIIDKILESSSIILITHVAPDGDALGCVTGMYKVLKNLKKDVDIFIDDDIPETYNFLPNIKKISKPYYKEADLILIIDCADENRIGKSKELLNSNTVTINIDHHVSNTLYAKMNYVDTNAASSAEIIYQLIKLLGAELDEDISTCLYTSIVTDTGGFMYESTTSITHEIAGDLINNGAKIKEVSERVFHNMKYSKAKLIGRVLSNLVLYNNGKIAYMEILKEDFKITETNIADIENIINYGRDINGVEVAVLLVEKDDEIKVSFRSKNKIDVNKIARFFGGGGHLRASGCTIKKSLSEVKKQVLDVILKELNEG